MCINVELNGILLANLNIEHLDTILAKHGKHHSARKLAGNFYNILLTHPWVASTLRLAASGLQNCNNFSC